jgi:hypothetical protein
MKGKPLPVFRQQAAERARATAAASGKTVRVTAVDVWFGTWTLDPTGLLESRIFQGATSRSVYSGRRDLQVSI